MNTVLSRYLTDILVLKNRKSFGIRAFSTILSIILLLVASFMENVFMNSLICLTVPFVGTFIAFESFMKTQKNPYTFALNPNNEENKKFIKNIFNFFYLSIIMLNVSLNLLTIQLVLGGLNPINIIISLILLGLIFFAEKNSIVKIFDKTNKETIMDIVQIVVILISSIVLKKIKDITLANPIIILVPFIIILSVVLYSFTMKNLNILIKKDVKTLSDKKYIGVKKFYDKELSHIAFMNKTLPSYNKETEEERKKRIEQERINQEEIVKSLGFPTPKELVEAARDYRARNATMWFNGRRITPKEYDEFCKRYGYDKYAKKEESASTLAKKEKTGGYVDVCDTKDATDRFNKKRR